MLDGDARFDAACEIARRAEVAGVLDALAAAGVRPVLIKGTPLAYSIYDSPIERPRCDTDMVIPREDVAAARRVFAARGYASTVYCDGELVFGQFEVQKQDALGVRHAFDIHWKISTQTLFADLLSHEDLDRESTPVRALGPHARAAGLVHALLIACVHPVMHHRTERRSVWTRDIHVLASRMTERDWAGFIDLAVQKEVATIVAHELDNARRTCGTAIPAVASALGARSRHPERSARYLDAGRGWRHEFAANLRHLPNWRNRVRLLREVLFPSVTYMSGSYRVDRDVAIAALPALYLHRLLSGSWKLLRGRK